MNHSEQTDKIFGALSLMQSKMLGAAKSADNPFFKSKYADLAEVWKAISTPLAENGLCVTQTFKSSEAGVVIITTLGHSSGQWISGELFLKPVKQDPQALGSAITYGRRYALSAICGVYQVDDDANEASQPKYEIKKEPEFKPKSGRFANQIAPKNIAQELADNKFHPNFGEI